MEILKGGRLGTKLKKKSKSKITWFTKRNIGICHWKEKRREETTSTFYFKKIKKMEGNKRKADKWREEESRYNSVF